VLVYAVCVMGLSLDGVLVLVWQNCLYCRFVVFSQSWSSRQPSGERRWTSFYGAELVEATQWRWQSDQRWPEVFSL